MWIEKRNHIERVTRQNKCPNTPSDTGLQSTPDILFPRLSLGTLTVNTRVYSARNCRTSVGSGTNVEDVPELTVPTESVIYSKLSLYRRQTALHCCIQVSGACRFYAYSDNRIKR